MVVSKNAEQQPLALDTSTGGVDDVRAPAFVMHPALLFAARRGDHELLEKLLRSEVDDEAAVLPQAVVVDVKHGGSSGLAPPSSPLEGVTFAGDSALHVVASSGDGHGFVESAKVIYGKAKHLLDARNGNGDTPLHSAARAGNVRVASCLIELAREDGGDGGGGGERMKTIMRVQNGRGETALHETVRFAREDMLEKFMSSDPGLARVPSDGTSPLYLAVLLGHDSVARRLYQHDRELSCSGPNGQNALHAAVLRGKGPTEMMLKWREDLTKQVDNFGSTPLHFAASIEGSRLALVWFRYFWRIHGPTKLLLKASPSSAFCPDKSGSFPIHVAALAGMHKAIISLISECPECAGLQDAKGRTFLHIAVKKNDYSIVSYACQRKVLEPVMNMKDSDGNTALHLAIQIGDLSIVSCLMRNKHVRLNLTNNEWETPRHLAESCIPPGIYYSMNRRRLIYRTLFYAHAPGGNIRHDHFLQQYISRRDEKEESKKIVESMQILGVGSVLVATVAFAAAFSVPGGYRAGDDGHAEADGTPVLAGSYAFNAFVVADALAFICSLLGTLDLLYAGMASIDFPIRLQHFTFAVGLVRCSVRSLAVAFALGLYVVLAPVARKTAITVCVIASATLFEAATEVVSMAVLARTLNSRLGMRIWYMIGVEILISLSLKFWTYILIFGLPVYLRN